MADERQVDGSVDTVQMRRPVFVDRSGRRDRRLRVAGWSLATVATMYAVGVGVSVLLAPGSPVGALPFGAVHLPTQPPEAAAPPTVPSPTGTTEQTTTQRPPTAPEPAAATRTLPRPPAQDQRSTGTSTPVSRASPTSDSPGPTGSRTPATESPSTSTTGATPAPSTSVSAAPTTGPTGGPTPTEHGPNPDHPGRAEAPEGSR